MSLSISSKEALFCFRKSHDRINPTAVKPTCHNDSAKDSATMAKKLKPTLTSRRRVAWAVYYDHDNAWNCSGPGNDLFQTV